MKSFVTVVAAGVTAASLLVAVPAGAEAGPRPTERPAAARSSARSAQPPGLTYTYAASADPDRTTSSRTQSTPEERTGEASARTAPGTAAASARFTPPPNVDFAIRYAPSVDSSKRAAFEAAAGVWSQVLEVEVPVVVDVSAQSFADPGILGGAAPTDLFANEASFPALNTWYVSAQANQFAGRDIDPNRAEIDVVISSDYDFYEGVDGQVPPEKISLLALALHELGHGLGHTTLAQSYPDGTGSIRFQGLALAYDTVIRNKDLVPLTALGPSALGQALTTRLLWGGAESVRLLAGVYPELYAPNLFQPGSSVSHLDEGVYRTDLMTPFIANGEAQTSIPALTQTMFADFGWGIEARTRAEAFVTATSRDFIKRFPTPTEMHRTAGFLDSGSVTRHQVAKEYGFSDEWIGANVDSYYLATLGRPADPAGKRHWSDKLRSGVTSATVVANFFASPEYFNRSGGTNRGWVQALYRGILDRDPDQAGWDSWTRAADAGTARTTIAFSIYQAPESRAKRVTGLYRSLLGRAPDPGGLAYWSDVLRNGRDIELAVSLASSPEYDNRATKRYL